MKVKEFTLTAVIPTAEYANIQPSITIEVDGDIDAAKKLALQHIVSISRAYAEPGKELAPKKKTLSGQLIKCFVGGQIYYNDEQHIYFNEKGERYLSGSAYAKQFEKEFDKTAIAQKMAEANNIDVNEILAVWEMKGDASRTFGTALHKALELAQAHKSVSERLNKQYHMEYHPTLENAVQGFLEAHNEDKVVCEAMVVDHNTKHVGQIDRLVVTGENKCIIGDYKTNIKMDKAKLTNYWNQLSFYADIMKNNGWEVEGLEIYHYNGAKWVDYKSEVLEIK